MKNLLIKIIALLKSNKKKAFSGLVLIVLLFLWKKREKILNYDRILAKFQEKIMSQLEKNLKQQQILASKLSQLDSIKSEFYSQTSKYKLQASQQITQLFLINDIKEDLKKKDMKSIEKQQLWERFKDENILFDTMVLSVSPLLSLSKLVKELVLGKFIKKEPKIIKSDLFVKIIEKILENFINHVNETGANDVFFYFCKKLQPDLHNLKVSNDMNLQSINDIFTNFEANTLNFVEKSKDIKQKVIKSKESFSYEKGIYWKNGISEKLSGVDYNEIGNYLIGKSKNMNNKAKYNDIKSLFVLNPNKKLIVPSVLLELIKEFLNKIKAHEIINDKKYLLNEIEHLKKIENSNNILDSFDKSPEIIDENLIFQKSLEENKNKEKKIQENENYLAEIILGLCNEIIDWLESNNFQVLYYHYIRFNFFKLKTRLILHKIKTKNDKTKLANFLTIIYRIMNEEFLADNADEINENFYKTRIKNNLAGFHNESANDLNEMLLNVRILEEYELNLRLQESLNEVLKRIYLDEYFEEKEVHAPVNEKNVEGKEFNEMMTILRQLG